MSRHVTSKSTKQAARPPTHGCRHKPDRSSVCVWEQKIDAYLQFIGLYWSDGVPAMNDPNPPAPNLVKLINLDRPYRIVAQNELFIIYAADGSTTPFAFQLGGVAAPDVRVCKRDTECTQVVNITEHAVYVNDGQNALVPGTLIFAALGNLFIILPEECDDTTGSAPLTEELSGFTQEDLQVLAGKHSGGLQSSLTMRVD